MKKVVIELPEDYNISESEAVIAMAAQLFEMGKLSLGQAAQLAGYEKRDFIEILSSYGVSVFNYLAEDVDNDLKSADLNNI
ncbi:UPF0175 family protein [Cryomorpha ignava]|uniref:UPF0175 family protein n=1 Tax=Cryomorpha ignava TaxID=101383 RepID=A0A7K3WRV8_9FLAO|nr:UPF0175 family protein [Cryomorpha ignava]NEN23791.1 UPF0175 family protein [Cryomorpha ignava]